MPSQYAPSTRRWSHRKSTPNSRKSFHFTSDLYPKNPVNLWPFPLSQHSNQKKLKRLEENSSQTQALTSFLKALSSLAPIVKAPLHIIQWSLSSLHELCEKLKKFLTSPTSPPRPAQTPTTHANYNFQRLPEQGDWSQNPGESLEDYLARLQASCYRKASQIRNLSEFLAYISHELRTPLNSIIGFTQHLLREPQDPNRTEWLKIIENSGKNLLLISTDLLDFSKLQAGTLKLHCGLFCPRKLFEETIQLLASSAHAKGLQLNLIFPSTAPKQVQGDALRLQQILANLLSNAIKYTPHGEVNCRVQWIELPSPHALGLRVTIEDTGPGIERKAQSQLFKNFMRLQENHENQELIPGSGLGLAICRKLIMAMQGEFGILSEPGIGSRFWFQIPIQPLGPMLGTPSLLAQFPPEPLVLIDAPSSISQLLKAQLAHEPLNCLSLTHEDFLSTPPPTSRWPRLIFINPTAPLPLSELALHVQACQKHDPDFRWILMVPFGVMGYSLQNLTKLNAHTLLYLPISHESLTQALQASLQTPPTTSTPPPLPSLPSSSALQREIWVVDDQPYNLKLLEAFAQPLGLRCFAFNSAEKAIQKLKASQCPPEFILLDIEMPQMNGIEARQAIENLHLQPAPQIFALTAGVSPTQIQNLKKVGFQQVLRKPIFFSAFKRLFASPTSRSLILPEKQERLQPALALQRLQGEAQLLTAYLEGGRQITETLLQALSESSPPTFLQRDLHHLTAITATLGMPKLTQKLQRGLERWRLSASGLPSATQKALQRALKSLLPQLQTALLNPILNAPSSEMSKSS